jgi:hypothetical protein
MRRECTLDGARMTARWVSVTLRDFGRQRRELRRCAKQGAHSTAKHMAKHNAKRAQANGSGEQSAELGRWKNYRPQGKGGTGGNNDDDAQRWRSRAWRMIKHS